jgi:glutathione synthase/RimK-type ligase-like ATP-grasp enzyme
MRIPRLAVATSPGFPELWREDRRLIPAFARHGVRAEPAVWSNPAVRWNDYDAVLMRSCWDYYRDYPAFMALLDRLDEWGIQMFNGSHVIRWNTDKRYLLDLMAAGVAVVATRVLASGTPEGLASLGASHGWTRMVVKPTISANGHDTLGVSLPLDAPTREALAPVLARGPVLVQPFAREIVDQGEYSLVFIDGGYSHAVLKRPGPGEFRVQLEYGGTADPYAPPGWMIEQAAHALGAAGRRTCYARVDGIARGGRFLLMELELAEPNLYLEFAPEAATRLAGAVVRELAAG